MSERVTVQGKDWQKRDDEAHDVPSLTEDTPINGCRAKLPAERHSNLLPNGGQNQATAPASRSEMQLRTVSRRRAGITGFDNACLTVGKSERISDTSRPVTTTTRSSIAGFVARR